MLKLLFSILLLTIKLSFVYSKTSNVIIVFDTNQILNKTLKTSDYLLISGGHIHNVPDDFKLKTKDELKDYFTIDTNFVYKKMETSSDKVFDAIITKVIDNVVLNNFDMVQLNLVDKHNKPQIKIKKNIFELIEGEDLTLNCVGVSLSSFSIKWLKDNKTLDVGIGDNYADLKVTIENMKISNGGKYVCVAENEDGKIEESINVTIKPSPINIKVKNKIIRINESESITLECDVNAGKSKENVTVFWMYNDNKKLPSNAIMNGTNLMLIDVERNLSGNFLCCGKMFKHIKNETIQLIVQYPAELIDNITEVQIIPTGSKANITCNVIGEPTPIIDWTINKNDVITYKKNTTIITTLKMSLNDEGFYTCHIWNGMGEKLIRNITVIAGASELPKIIKSNNTDIILNSGDDLQLICKCYDCTPIKNNKWTIDDDEVEHTSDDYEIIERINIEKDPYLDTDDTEIRSFSYELKIEKIQKENEGKYECLIANEFGDDLQTFDVQVLEATDIDKITETNNELNVIEGTKTYIKCEINGEPIQIAQWSKDGVPILSSQRFFSDSNNTLTVDNTQFNDAGIYSCKGINHRNLIIKNFTLLVIAPSNMKSEPSSLVTGISGSNITLPCQITKINPPNIQWFTNGIKLNTDDDTKYVSSNNSLSFMIEPTDTSIYECRVINGTENITQDTILVVYVAPSIYPIDDEIIKVTSNSDIVLNCETTGFPMPEKSWSFNGTDVMDKENEINSESDYDNDDDDDEEINDKFEIIDSGNLKINNITINSEGSYTCNSHNIIGIKQKIFHIIVLDRPKILTNFSNSILLLPGDKKQIDCEAIGNPHPNIIWKKDGKTVDKKNLLENSLVLTSRNVQLAGNYTCFAENTQGIDSRNIEIRIVDKPKIKPGHFSPEDFYISRKNIYPELLVCPIDQTTNLKWTRTDLNGNIPEKSINFTMDFEGYHTCSVKNEAGEMNFTIKVSYSIEPHNLTALDQTNDNSTAEEIIEIDADSSLMLYCFAAGNPQPKISWLKDDLVVSKNEELIFSSIQLNENGTYICNATNNEGSLIKSYDIIVKAKPQYKNDELEQFISIKYGTELELDCSSTGNPAPTFSWFKNDIELYDEEMMFFTIEETEITDLGIYKCIAENSLGNIEIVFHVDVLDNKKIQYISENIDLILNDDDDDDDVPKNINLTCRVTSYLYPTVSWVFNDQLLTTTSHTINLPDFKENISKSNYLLIGPNDTTTFTYDEDTDLKDFHYYSELKQTYFDEDSEEITFNLIITNVTFEDSGEYVCFVDNEMGRIKKETYVKIMVSPSSNNKEERKTIELLDGLPLVINCNISGYPEPTIQWFKDDKLIENSIEYDIQITNSGKELWIEKLNDSHEGEYLCEGKNKAGEKKNYFDVKLLVKPTFIRMQIKYDENIEIEQDEENISVGENTDLDLTCEFYGYPKPSVYWYKYITASAVPTSILMAINETLHIRSIKKSDQYFCFANSTVGTHRKLFHIKVHALPFIESNSIGEETMIVDSNENVELYCRAFGDPTPTITWTRNGERLSSDKDDVFIPDDGRICKIPKIRSTEAGRYECIAVNNYGLANKVFNVRVRELAWSEWSTCSKSCGPGIQRRTHVCVSEDNNDCRGKRTKTETQYCELKACAINGGWSEWSSWSKCSITCRNDDDKSQGKIIRSRKCNSPTPKFGGKKCDGSHYEAHPCFAPPCIINGDWSQWRRISNCSAICGDGYVIEKRSCNNPQPSRLGKFCEGPAERKANCYLHPCHKSIINRCNRGFILNKESNICNDINECYKTNRCNDDTRQCINTHGSYKCICLPGYSSENDRLPCIRIPSNLQLPLKNSQNNIKFNKHECLNRIGKRCSHFCILKNGKFSCACPSYMKLSERDKSTCRTLLPSDVICNNGYKYSKHFDACYDIDECSDKNMNLCQRVCVNLPGSYRCDCNSNEYIASDGRSCIRR